MVTGNEPLNGPGDGNTDNTIEAMAMFDGGTVPCRQEFQVTVPHDLGNHIGQN